ncbi:LirA/MavJ family T4SS effector [Pseudomonas nitroreducens]|uniref:LirA/MavJ family T4SS effector n=1 Tax=Pseudomonas nitroreducens TaxID=46680 RepID=UPI0011325F3A|nr:LirA/MavJ family T4SS effector [Pseudomonas nitroreducens]
MPNPFDEVGDKNIVTTELVDYFEDAIGYITQFSLSGAFLRDCAVICAFLQSKKVFENFYIRTVDPALEAAYSIEKPSSSIKGGGLMRAFHSLMQNHGFNTLRGVVFTGNAGGFVDVVSNGILFKDMTGPMHGEYTHSLQWLSVCFLQTINCANVVEGGHIFSVPIADIYKRIVTQKVYWINNNSIVRFTENWPGELSFSSKRPQAAAPKTLWDFIVDAFSAKAPVTNVPLAEENPLQNLYTDSYRCPANITIALQWGALQRTFIGQYWQARIDRYAQAAPTNRKWFHPNIYRGMANTNQTAKRTLDNANTWRAPNKVIPPYTPPPPPPQRQMSLDKIDRFSPPDPWDDEDY